MFNNDNPILRINETYDSMYKKEKCIAEVIINNPDKVITSSIKELADEAGTSESSVVRFCKQIGYSGYSELKIEIAKSSYSLDSSQDSLNSDINDEEIIKKLYEDSIDKLNNYGNHIDYNMIKKVAKLVYDSKMLLIFGNDISGLMATGFSEKIAQFGIPSIIFSNKVSMKKGCMMMSEKVSSLFISNTGTTASTVNSAKYAFENDYKTIVITKSDKTNINKYSENIIYVPFFETSLLQYSFATKIAMQIILDLIAVEIELLYKERSEKLNEEYGDLLFRDALE